MTKNVQKYAILTCRGWEAIKHKKIVICFEMHEKAKLLFKSL